MASPALALVSPPSHPLLQDLAASEASQCWWLVQTFSWPTTSPALKSLWLPCVAAVGPGVAAAPGSRGPHPRAQGGRSLALSRSLLFHGLFRLHRGLLRPLRSRLPSRSLALTLALLLLCGLLQVVVLVVLDFVG